MAVLASFYRAGAAYLLDNGARMADGLPRFPPGKFAGTRGLRIEEGTTNILTANQSNVETDSTGFSALLGATVSRSTTYAFEGSASLKIVFNGTAFSGMEVNTVTDVQGTYVARVRAREATGLSLLNAVNLFLRIMYTDASLDQSLLALTPTLLWGDYITAPIASNPAKIVSNVLLMVRQNNLDMLGIDLWVDALQVEIQTEATTWHVGGGTRASERVLVPTLALFDPAAGTVEAWVRVEALVESHIVFDTRQLGDALTTIGRCLLRVDSAGGALNFYYWNGTALRIIGGGNLIAKTWTHVAASWGPTGGKVYRNGALITSHADVPVLFNSPRMSLGGRADAGDTSSGMILGGMRFTRGRARSNADILAAYNSGLQFTEDGTDSTVFSFDGTTRSLLPATTHRILPESAFLMPIAITASTTATNYGALNMADWEFPLLSHRTTTGTTQATLTFDFGYVVNFRAFFVALVNWEWCTLSASYDGITYTSVPGSPIACDIDPADQYRKWGGEINASGRYARIIIPVQQIDALAGYFETPLVIFAGDCDALAANTNWGINLSVTSPYQSNDAGAHSEIQAQGKQYVTMQVQSDPARGARSTEWQQLAALGNHRKFLLFTNLGNPAECYLMRSDGNVTWEEQSGYNTFSMTWREHIN